MPSAKTQNPNPSGDPCYLFTEDAEYLEFDLRLHLRDDKIVLAAATKLVVVTAVFMLALELPNRHSKRLIKPLEASGSNEWSGLTTSSEGLNANRTDQRYPHRRTG